jgi:hypothetical protein
VYALPPLPFAESVTRPLGFVLFAELFVFYPAAALAAAVVAVLLALALVRRLGRGRRAAGPPAPAAGTVRILDPWLHTLAWALLFCGHLALDVNPYLTAVCLSGTLLLLPGFWRALGRAWSPLAKHRRAPWLGLAALWWLGADDAAVRLAVIAWMLVLLAAWRGPARALAARDRIVAVLLCIPAVQAIPAFVPLAIPMHDGRRIGDAMAYSFCEDPRSHRLFAVVPRCSANQTDKCRRQSTIEELDARTLDRRAEYRFFSDRYAGRLEQIACIGDRVQVGMDYTVVDGQGLAQNLLEFSSSRPSDFTTNALGGAAGDGIAYDRRRRVAFYRTDDHQILRRDLRTGHLDRHPVQPSSAWSPIADIGFHEKRDSLFVARSSGSVLELDPETLARRAVYPIINAWEFTIDEELDRLYVAGSWGLEVVDLRRRRTVARARIGFGARRPAIDGAHGLIYVPSTAAGRLQVFDRRNLRRVGAIPLGIGVRFPYVSEEHGHVLASSATAYYAWDAQDLARRLRGRGDRRGRPRP